MNYENIDENNILKLKIKARAVANEFPIGSYPLCINNKPVLDNTGHIAITKDGIHQLEPINIIRNSNIFVTTGKYWLGDVAIGVKSTSLSYIAVGTGTTEPSASDTNVEGQIGSRMVYTTGGRFRTYTTITISAFFDSADNNGTWGNAGVFTQATGGDMFCHSTFETPVVKTIENTQRIDFDITIA